mmetsp:Transcript_58268/g.136532  ORF Transcript_58268/g.136532 Transcript_58268/m.136532 type:complete len:119 (+) Transcript_58268:261-617(+)
MLWLCVSDVPSTTSQSWYSMRRVLKFSECDNPNKIDAHVLNLHYLWFLHYMEALADKNKSPRRFPAHPLLLRCPHHAQTCAALPSSPLYPSTSQATGSTSEQSRSMDLSLPSSLRVRG